MSRGINKKGWKQGEYICKYPEKYIGTGKILYKSGLEQRMMFWCDNNKNVIRWSYEKNIIEYPKPIFENSQLHHIETRRYFLDFYAEILDKTGNIKKFLIEVKCRKETLPPIRPKKITPKNNKRYLHECETYAINSAKWNQANLFCKAKGWNFIIITDDRIQ